MSFNTSNRKDVTVSKTMVIKAALRRASTGIKMSIAVALLFYLVFALTVVRLVPGVGGGAGLILSKTDTFYGGIIPVSEESEQKTQVLIDRVSSHDNSLMDNLSQAFMINPNTAVVDVYAGPTGMLQWAQPNIITVNGKALPGPMNPAVETLRNPEGNPINEKVYLNNEYLGICVKGACETGEVVLFGENQVMGVPVFPQEPATEESNE